MKAEEFRKAVRGQLEQADGLESAVMLSIGAGSVCWSERPTGEFDSVKAEIVGDELLQYLYGYVHPQGQSLAAGQDWDAATGWKFSNKESP